MRLRLGIVAAALALIGIAAGNAVAEAVNAAPPASLEQIREWNRVGQTQRAEAAARAALTEAERSQGMDSIGVAEILDELAVALRRGGKSAEPEALRVCERALRIKEGAFGTRDPRYATSLYNLGMLHFMRKEYASALSELNQALEIRKSTLGSNHADVAKSLLALGSLHRDMGNYEEGLSLTERAVAIEKIALGASNPDRALGLNALAVARYSLGDFAGSIPLYEEAIGLCERAPSPNQVTIAACYQNLGASLDGVGDHTRAIEALDRALRLREEQYGASHPMVATTLSNLGSVLLDVGEIPRARKHLRRAIQILEAKAPQDPDLGWVRAKLGWLYIKDGDLGRAGEAFRLSLREQEQALGPDHPDLWMSLRGLAMVAKERKEVESARGYYERTVKLLRRSSGPNHPDLGLTLVEYASFQLASGDSLAALHTALEAARINREQVRLTVQSVAERQALLYIADMDTGMDVAFTALTSARGAQSEDLVRQVWDALVRSRTLVLDEMTDRAKMVGRAGGVVEVARRLEAARSRLANLLVRGPSGESPEQSRALVDRAREEVERGERDLAAQGASFRREYDRGAVGFEQVASALPSGSALISIARYGHGHGQSYLAFLMADDRKPRIVALGSAEQIDHLIARWRDIAGRPPGAGPREVARSEAACRAAGQALRARIWDPLSGFLGGSRRVFIVPDGAFHLLNIVALPTPDGGYLVESPLVFHHLSAERDIVKESDLGARGVGLLALGGPSFDTREAPRSPESTPPATTGTGPTPDSTRASMRGGLPDCESFRSVRFRPLPETVREIDEIAELWGRPDEVVVLKGDGASERSVKELLPGRRVAHFATHGFFLDDQCAEPDSAGGNGERGIGGLSVIGPSHSALPSAANPFRLAGLALAGANRRETAAPGEEDGILTAEEISSLDLSALDWVVLSACDTGVGDVQSGEGVLGLRRAFEAAGAGTLIMSLWAVQDRSAREWMALLYQGRFQKDLETAEAVREADIGVLKSLRAQGHSTLPFYWAAFVAAGGWR